MPDVDQKKYPYTHEFCQHLNGKLHKGLIENIDYNSSLDPDAYPAHCEEILKLIASMGYNPFDVFFRYILTYLKDLARFEKNGSYNNGTFEEIRDRIYDNKKKMMSVYMPGLFLSYAITTILHVKYRFLRDSFLPLIKPGSRGLDFGFGEGFYTWQILKNCPEVFLQGYDISPSAIEFSSKVLPLAKINADCYSLRHGNLCEGIDDTGGYDWCILAEIIEHVPDSTFALREICRLLAPGGKLFLTTVIDSNHMDHMINFADVGEVEALINDNGFTVMENMVFRNNHVFPDSGDISQGIGIIACKG